MQYPFLEKGCNFMRQNGINGTSTPEWTGHIQEYKPVNDVHSIMKVLATTLSVGEFPYPTTRLSCEFALKPLRAQRGISQICIRLPK